MERTSKEIAWDMWKLWHEQRGRCALTGYKLTKENAQIDHIELKQKFCLIVTIKDLTRTHEVYNEVSTLLDARNFANSSIGIKHALDLDASM